MQESEEETTTSQQAATCGGVWPISGANHSLSSRRASSQLIIQEIFIWYVPLLECTNLALLEPSTLKVNSLPKCYNLVHSLLASTILVHTFIRFAILVLSAFIGSQTWLIDC